MGILAGEPWKKMLATTCDADDTVPVCCDLSVHHVSTGGIAIF